MIAAFPGLYDRKGLPVPQQATHDYLSRNYQQARTTTQKYLKT